MSPQQKKIFIKNHFSKQCIILLSDVRKTKDHKDLQAKAQKYVRTSGRKKHSCYICFEKFFLKEELEIHKVVHRNENKNNTFSDENDDCDDEVVETSNSTSEDTKSNMNEEICKSLEMETTQNIDETTQNMDETTQNIEETTQNMDETTQNIEETTLEVIETNEKQDLNEAEHSNYRCIKCKVNFKNQEDIKCHLHTQHWCKYHCRQCGRQFNTKGGFIVHVLQHNIANISKYSYKCSKCRIGFNDCFELQRHNTAVHNEVSKNSKPDVKLEQSDFTGVIEESTIAEHIVVADHLEHLKKDNDNPITGSIPIYDCDICYDVFASEKSLNRHKVLHMEFEKMTDSFDGETIVVQDNEPEIILTRDLNKVVTEETPKNTAVSMAQFTPMYSGDTSSLVTFPPNILSTVPTQRNLTKIRSKMQPVKDATANSISDVRTITPSTKQIIPEKPLQPDQVYPYLTSRPEVLPTTLPRLIPKETPVTSATKPALHPYPISQDSSKQTKIPLPTESPQIMLDKNQSQFMYVLCPQSGTISGLPPQSGPTLMVPGSSSPTMFSFNQQVKENPDTIMPSSGQNQVIINQQTNTGGVVINNQASGLHAGTFAINQNNARNKQSFGCAPVEGAPMFYILLPPNQSNQEVTAKKQIPQKTHLLNTLPDIKQKPETPSNIKIKPNSLKIIRRKKTSLLKKNQGYDPSEPLVMPIITSVTGTNIEEEEPVGKEVNTDTVQETQYKNTTELVMPIITSIGTVAEESTNTKEKIRTDPVSQYESEFAKFLQESEDSKPNSRKNIIKKNINFKKAKLDISSTPSIAGTSNDDVICVDDNSSSSEHEFKRNESNSGENLSFKIVPAVKEKNKEAKQKIFVKKLSDLVDKTNSKNDMYMHCCLRCNSQFKDWVGLREHVSKQHLMQACKFDMCLILGSQAEYDKHIYESHRCSFCGNDFRILAAHKRNCSDRKTDTQIQPSDHINQSIIVQASDQENIFILTNPAPNITSEDTSCNQK